MCSEYLFSKDIMYGIFDSKRLLLYCSMLLLLSIMSSEYSLSEHIWSSEKHKETDFDLALRNVQQYPTTTDHSESSTHETRTSVVVTTTSSAFAERNDEPYQCGKNSLCPGNRPPSQEYCICFAMAWEKCGFNTGKQCDTDLGLRCVPKEKSLQLKRYGLCRGKYNVKILSTGYTYVSLKWDNFKPKHYPYEYVVLYRETFHPDVWQWHSNAYGAEPGALILGLKVNQGYFFRVTIWNDPVKEMYGNITEAVYAKTKAGCVFQGKAYKPGELYEVKCEDKCTCMASGKFTCEPVCPEERHYPRLNNPMFNCTRRLINQSECCYETICEPIDKNNCLYQNGTLNHGEKVRNGCNGICSCENGMLHCSKICHTDVAPTMLNECSRIYMPTQCCPLWICEQVKHPYSSAVLSSVLWLQGTCSNTNTPLTKVIRDAVLNYIGNDAVSKQSCYIGFSVKISCHDSKQSKANRQKGQPFEIKIFLEWKMYLNTGELTDLVNGTAGLWKSYKEIINALTEPQFEITVAKTVYGPAVSDGNPVLSYLCETGFLKTESGCVKYEQFNTTHENTVDIYFEVLKLRRTSCLLKWHQIAPQSRNSTRALYVVYRKQALKSTVWLWSEALNSTTQVYNVRSLLPGRRYEAGLMWLPSIDGMKRLLLASLNFRTKSRKVIPANHATIKVATPVCIIVLLIVVCVSVYFIWKRQKHRKNNSETTFYENKGFWVNSEINCSEMH